MGFRTGSYCTIWNVKGGQGNYMDVNLSSSRKNKSTGEYETDFSGFCRFCGNAKAKAEKLRERDRIRLGDVDVTRRYDKEKSKEYTNFVVFDFEMVDSNGSAHTASAVDDPTEEILDEPF